MRVVLGILLIAGAAACGGGGENAADDGRLRIVVTTSVLGDVVEHVAGSAAEIEVVLPRGADPHEFAPSARQAEAMVEADLLVVNGAGFEAGLESSIEAAEDAGTEILVAADHAELLDDDPHFWTDPSRMVEVAEAVGAALGVDPSAYVEALRALDAEIEAVLADVPAERRVLVTNHEVLGYFADRYGFEVVGAVIPSLSTRAEASAADIEDLADVLRARDVPAVFAETTSSADLARALADQVGDVAVVELFAESLGDEGSGAATYVEMQRTNAQRIAEALA